MYDIRHLQQDEIEGAETHRAPTCTHTQQYKTKAAMLIAKTIKQNPALEAYDNLRSTLKTKKEKANTHTV